MRLRSQMNSVAQSFTPPPPTPLTRKPLKGKRVFFDTKGSSVQLRRQLEALGARVETFFSKDIWCVITDKQIRDHEQRGIGLLCGALSQGKSDVSSAKVV